MGKITRKGNFDSGHRVMNERMKCFNVHGHTYVYEITFEFDNMLEIGYAIDFKEIKRVFAQWIDDDLDHGMILNPQDADLIHVTKNLGSKLWLMSLNGLGQYCNPSVENIATEVYLALEILTDTLYGGDGTGLRVYEVKINETPNCSTTVRAEDITDLMRDNFYAVNELRLETYAKMKGVVEYDDRKVGS